MNKDNYHTKNDLYAKPDYKKHLDPVYQQLCPCNQSSFPGI